MGRGWTRGVGVAAAMAVLGAAGGAGLWAAQPSDRPTVDASMSMLVTEIKALREAVERSGLVTAQAQLLLGRVQLQEARLATLGRQAQESRERLEEAERAESGLTHQLRQVTSALSTLPNGEERDELERGRIPELKEQVRLAQVRTQRLRAQESAAAAALAEEQGRWQDFNGRLEALERTVASILATRGRP